jgi:ribosome-binding factor A
VADPARARKLAKRISQIVANAIEHEIKDPRLNGVTVTDTKVTADLHDATVYYTVFGDKLDAAPDAAAVASALTAATGVLRTKVGQGTGVRFTPTLVFVADTVGETVKAVDDLLERARAADAEVAALAANAKPAGDPDPYKAPREEVEED